MKPNTIYSKSGKGVQEASGKTSLLKRGDRAVLSAIDGRATLAEVALKVGKTYDGPFQQLIAQLDRDGFVREVTAAPSNASQSRPAMAAVRPAPAPAKPPAAKAAASEGDDLDFTAIMPAVKRSAAAQPAPAPAAPAPRPAVAKEQEAALAKGQEAALYKARQEAEARAQAERDRLRQEAEAKARAETEAKIRAETEKKVREEAEGKLRAEAEAKAKAARDVALRIAAQAKAKVEAEAQVKIEAERRIRDEVERKAKEEAEKARRETEELRQRLDEERKAREAEERKRKEDEERRRREEAERKAREDAERQRREEEERIRREDEEQRRREEEERRMREEIEAKAREAAERARREEEDRRLQEKETQARQARDMEQARERASRRQLEEEARSRKAEEEDTRTRQPVLPAAAPERRPDPAATSGGGSLDALMADLDSFSQREDAERQAREADDRKARAEKKRKSDEEAERLARERAAHEEQERNRAAEESRRREEEERRAQEEAERRVREAEEHRRLEAEERKLRAREALAAKTQAVSGAAAAAASDDLPVSEADLGMDDVRRDEAAVARETRKAEREREREARQRSREAKERAEAAAREKPIKYPKARRPVKWGRPVAITLFVLLVAAVGVLHIMPLPMADYEDAASEAFGRPVKIGSARLSLFTGVRLNLQDVTVGGTVRIASVHAYPRIGSLIDEKKAFRRIELDGVRIPQQAIGEAFSARMRMDNFAVGRILVQNLKLEGPVPLPALEADAVIGADGALRTLTLRGPDSLDAKLTPAPNGEVELDVTAASIALPFVQPLTLSSFAMKGIANRQGINIGSWGGAALDGALSGTARLRWGGPWQLEGVVLFRGINAAVFAPALLSEGKAEGSGRFSMSGTDPAKLYNGARIEGSFNVGKGTLGSFDLSRVLQTSGRQHGGRTQFTEMSGQGVYDRGAVALRNISMTAGALHAGASADIAPSGALAGRIVADIRTTVQPLRAVVVIGGTVQEPQVRN
jgi:hypothetical protein